MRNWDSLLSESSDTDPSHTLSYSSQARSAKTPNMSPCGWEKDWESVQSVCSYVGIPEDKVKLVDLSREYWTRVFEPAINVWENGGTPNPDVACNREIKFGALLDYIPKTSRSFLATGELDSGLFVGGRATDRGRQRASQASQGITRVD